MREKGELALNCLFDRSQSHPPCTVVKDIVWKPLLSDNFVASQSLGYTLLFSDESRDLVGPTQVSRGVPGAQTLR